MDRIAVLGALADPHRLSIVDELAHQDLSPGELGERLAMPSNLLAHHLRVLAAAKAVKRRRSEGDARRTYVTLRWANPLVAAAVRAAPIPEAPRVVFVCTQNSARSPMAASALAARGVVPAASAGTRPAGRVNPLAVEAMRKRGLEPLSENPALLDDVARPGDLLVAVCDSAHEELAAQRMPHLHWSVKDPGPSDRRKRFTEALSAIQPRVDRLAAALVQEGTP